MIVRLIFKIVFFCLLYSFCYSQENSKIDTSNAYRNAIKSIYLLRGCKGEVKYKDSIIIGLMCAINYKDSIIEVNNNIREDYANYNLQLQGIIRGKKREINKWKWITGGSVAGSVAIILAILFGRR